MLNDDDNDESERLAFKPQNKNWLKQKELGEKVNSMYLRIHTYTHEKNKLHLEHKLGREEV